MQLNPYKNVYKWLKKEIFSNSIINNIYKKNYRKIKIHLLENSLILFLFLETINAMHPNEAILKNSQNIIKKKIKNI